jgi:hypothetical protein
MSTTVAGPCGHVDDVTSCTAQPVSCAQLLYRAGFDVVPRALVLNGCTDQLAPVVELRATT